MASRVALGWLLVLPVSLVSAGCWTAPVVPMVTTAAFQLSPVAMTSVGPVPTGTTPYSPATAPNGKPSGNPVGNPPAPKPGGSGGSGGGGASGGPGVPAGPGAPVDLEGQILQARTMMAMPVAGAEVAAEGPDGVIVASADDEGRFALAGLVPGTPLVVSAPGYAASMVVGWEGTSLTLHLLQTEAGVQRPEAMIPVSGFVLHDDISPASGAIVFGGNGRGTTFGPFTTDEDGRFEGFATSTDGVTVSDLAAWAYVQRPNEMPQAIGLTMNGAAGAGAEPIQVRLVQPSGTVSLRPTAPAGLGSARITARAPNGVEATLATWWGFNRITPCPFFALPGMALTAEVDVASDDGEARSSWRSVVQAPGVLEAKLLAYPAPPTMAGPGFGEAQTMVWPAVAEATGYRVAMRPEGNGPLLWEGYTPQPRLTFKGLPAEAPHTLEVYAIGGERSALRHVASAPNCLKFLETVDGPERCSTRRIALVPSP